MRRKFCLIGVMLLILALLISSGRSAAVPAPAKIGTLFVVAGQLSPTGTAIDEPSEDTFSTPSAVPTSIPTRGDVHACSGEGCNGTDPHQTGCDDPEKGAYTQTAKEVLDTQGNLMGTLYLRANHSGCGSTQWALFADLTKPLTFQLRVVQNRTGLSTETVMMQDWREDTWTMQMHSPDERVRAEVRILDQNGNVLVSAFTDSY